MIFRNCLLIHYNTCPATWGIRKGLLSHGYVIFLLFFTIEHIPMSVMNASFMSRTYHPRPAASGDMSCSRLTNLMSRIPSYDN